MKAAVIVAFSVLPVFGQVQVRFTPEPMAVPTAVIANARSLGRWQIELCNDGPTLVVLSWERLSMAAGNLRLLNPDEALLVLTASVRRSPASRILTVLTWAGRGAAVGLAIASKSNINWAAGIGVGSSALPEVIEWVRGEVPSAAPLISKVQWPVALPPGGCLTDFRFAAKMHRPQVFSVTIR